MSTAAYVTWAWQKAQLALYAGSMRESFSGDMFWQGDVDDEIVELFLARAE